MFSNMFWWWYISIGIQTIEDNAKLKSLNGAFVK